MSNVFCLFVGSFSFKKLWGFAPFFRHRPWLAKNGLNLFHTVECSARSPCLAVFLCQAHGISTPNSSCLNFTFSDLFHIVECSARSPCLAVFLCQAHGISTPNSSCLNFTFSDLFHIVECSARSPCLAVFLCQAHGISTPNSSASSSIACNGSR